VTGAPLGVVVNPVAGMGGRVGLHGTDGAALDLARLRGARPVAPPRARRALDRFRALAPTARILPAPGPLGADYLAGALSDRPPDRPEWTVEVRTTAEDTHRAVRALADEGVALVLFVGGDGTARDVVGALDAGVPVLGVPAGVKMHSGVFATTPEAAAETAARFVADPARVGCVVAEVVDIADGRGSPHLFGVATVPNAGAAIQRAKAGTTPGDAAALAALGRAVAREMVPDRLYLLGPGTTVAQVNDALGLPATLLGVDVVRDGVLLAADAGEAELLTLLRAHPAATLVLGVVGGQGFLLGRGNQQLSPAVLDAVGPANVEILAAAGKLAALDPPVLRIDVGDDSASAPITGYCRVRTGPGRSTVLKVVA
jgi:predicted polyphosphate/ATP-dependent NAD kinase